MIKRIVRRSRILNRLVYDYGYGVRVPFRLLLLNSLFRYLFGINKGSRHSVHYTSKVVCPENLILQGNGAGTVQSLALSGGCYIQAGHGVSIGEGTIWSFNVAIVSANHDISKPDKTWSEKKTPVFIGRNCWIGANAVILPGVLLGDSTIVGASAVVTKSFPEGHVTLVGNPARPLGLE